MRRSRMRIDLDIVPRSLPDVVCIGQQVLDLKRVILVDSQNAEIQFEPPRMPMRGTQIDDDHYDVGTVRSALAVTDYLVVGDVVEPETPIALQGGVLAPDTIDPSDKLAQTVRPVEIPMPDFIFLRMQVFFTPRLAGLVLAEFIGRPVNAVTGTERRRQHQP